MIDQGLASAELDVSVVVPVYGGAATVATLHAGLAATLADRRWEVLFVCDRPRDASWPAVQQLAAADPDRVRGVLLGKNCGQHAATLCGIRLARGHTLVTMDEDLQHDPRDVPALIERSRRDDALVYGVSVELHHGALRNAASRIAKWFIGRYLGVAHGTQMSAFRAFPARARTWFAQYHAPMVAIDVLLSWAALPVVSLPCAHAPRLAGQSGYTLAKLVTHLGNLAFGFSTAPLRLATWAGLAAMMLAMSLALYVVVGWLIYGSAVPGFAFLGLTVTLLGGAQLLALGLLGEYLGRLYGQGLGRPQFVVAQTTWASGRPADAPSAEAT